MSQNRGDSEIPVPVGRTNNWKTNLLRVAGFGGGFAIVAVLVLGAIFWWTSRPKQWSDRSIKAKPTQLIMQQTGEDLRFEFRYAFTNHTSAEYALPSPDMGALMRKLPKDGTLDKMDGATWDTTIRIPPQQSIGVAFMMFYKFSNYNTSAAELEPEAKLTQFAGARLKEIDGLVFFDYASKYKVEMPKNWDSPQKQEPEMPKNWDSPQKQEPEKKANAIVPPDKGDVFDKLQACEQAANLAQRCKQANVSLASSPWIKYGGWPEKLRDLPTPPAGFTLDPTPDTCAIAAEWQNYCKAKVK